jgi:hypothetical protein
MQQVVFFKEMQEQRSRYQVLGKIWKESLCKLLLWRSSASSIISQSRVHAWSPTEAVLRTQALPLERESVGSVRSQAISKQVSLEDWGI